MPRSVGTGSTSTAMNASPRDSLAWAAHLESVARGAWGDGDCPRDPPESLLRAARTGDAPERILWQIAAGGAFPERQILDLDSVGPLWAPGRWSAIEVWTESELCGLHALARLRRSGAGSDAATLVSRRLRGAILWHLEHTQPDNATHRPWAIHLFLGHPDPEVDLYGQSLLHAYEAAGRGDRDAAWILLDAAREIRLDPAVATRW